MKKKFFSVIITIAMLLSMITITPMSAYAAVEEDWTYTLYDHDTTAAITGYTGTDISITIPSTIAGKPVTRIGSNAFKDNTTVTSVTIPDSVLRIEDSAFLNSNLTTINLGEGVTYIGPYAFNGTNITSVTIPASVEAIEYAAFALCLNLSDVTIIGNNLSTLSYGAFADTAIDEFRIPTSLSIIENLTFQNCTSLSSIIIPSNISEIQYSAFNGCSNLVSATFEGNAPTMGNFVFSNVDPDFIVYYYSGATGFSTPTWTTGLETYNTVMLGGTTDTEAPTLTGHSVWRVDGETAEIRFMSNESGTYYYKVTNSNSNPSTENITGWTLGGEISSDTIVTFTPSSISSGEKYVNIAIKDSSDNFSDVLTVSILNDYYYYDNFEVYPLNTTIKSNSLYPITQIHNGTGDANQKVVDAVNSTSAKMLSLSSTSGNASDQVVLLDKTKLSNSSSYVFEGDVYPLGTDGWQLRFSFTNGSYEASNEAGVFFIDGKITTATRSGAIQLKDSYISNEWHHVKIIVTPSINKYAVYVDNELLNNSLSLPTNIDRLAITAGHGKTAYFDNLEFYVDTNYACEIGTQKYASLSSALASVVNGDTITLLQDIAYSDSIIADGIAYSIDLNGFDLSVENVTSHALQAINSGTLNISDANGIGTLTVNSLGAEKYAAYAGLGGSINITGNLSAIYTGGLNNQAIFGAYANGNGSTINIIGNSYGYTAGVYAHNGAAITVNGNVSGSYYGAYAAYGGSVDITGDVDAVTNGLTVEYGGIAEVEGDITAETGVYINNIDGWDYPTANIIGNITSTSYYAINAGGDANIDVFGNITGCVTMQGTSSSSTLDIIGNIDFDNGPAVNHGSGTMVVTGNITSSEGFGVSSNSTFTINGDIIAKHGVHSYAPSGNIIINGDIVADGGYGVYIYNGAIVTVNGVISGASPYIRLDYIDYTEGSGIVSGDYYVYSTYTNNNPAYVHTVKVKLLNTVCEVDGVKYATLDDGLEAATNGGTIKLLADINYNSGLLIENKSIVFDLSGYTLNLSSTADWGYGLEVGVGGIVNIDDTAGGSLNIFGNNSSTNYGVGLYIHDGGSATVTNITSYGWANGADCTGGSLVVKGDVQSGGNGTFAQSGSYVVVEGDIWSGGMGAIASWEETLIEIKGNVYATNGLGLSVSAGTIKVDGNVQSNNFGGVSVAFNGTAEIGGNVTASSFGAEVKNGGTISIDGVITASQYILLDEILTSADDFILNGNGYYLYKDNENLVMVKAHYCIIDGCSMSIDDGGFTEYTVMDGKTYYHVYNAKQLSHINEHLNLNFIQMNDINLTGIDWTPIGITYDTPFRGVYNGNGYSITNLNVNQLANTTNKSGGLFGALMGDGAIKNLSVSGNVTYRVNWYATSSMTGGIAASMFSENGNRPIIDNCSFTGNVTAIAHVTIANNRVSSFAGGIVGYARDGIIKNCSYKGGNILANTIPNTGSTTFAHAGGIAGNLNQNALIINCYTSKDSNVSATNSSYNNAGGIAGQLQYNSTISVSYNAGNVDAAAEDGGSIEIGGILGQSEGENTISNSYWIDSCGALNQVGNDDTTSTAGKMTDDVMNSISFSDTLNNALNVIADTTLYTWSQDTGNYPSLSHVFWITPPPSGSDGSSSRLPAIIVATDEINNLIINSTKISSSTVSGTTTANMSTRVVDALLDKISNNGGDSKNDLIELIVNSNVDIKELKVSILQKDLAEIIDKTDAKFRITSPFISIVFDDEALDAISSVDDDGTIVISAGVIDNEELSEEELAKVQKRPVYDLTVTNGGKNVADFNGGHATVTIPYRLQPGEDPDAVVVYYIDDNKTLHTVRGHYNEDLKAVVFKTTHFSKFVIGYNYVAFADVYKNSWYKNAVDYISARGITTGTGNNNFSPDANLTRAQFVVLLMNAYQINNQDKAQLSQLKNFDDAGNTYYTEYLLAAKSLGIVNGIGNNLFAPEKEITRQEMCVMLYNALDILDEVPEHITSKQLSSFNDADLVVDWAEEAFSSLVNTGIIKGTNNNLQPTSNTTRAEIAQVLYNLLSK